MSILQVKTCSPLYNISLSYYRKLDLNYEIHNFFKY